MNQPNILKETKTWAIINKPPLLDCQNSREGRPSLVAWLERRWGFAGLIHRLDFGTSGAMICAKTPEGAKKLTEDLQEGKLERIYRATVIGQLSTQATDPSGRPLRPLGPHPSWEKLQNTPFETIDAPLEGKESLSHIWPLELFANGTEIAVQLQTGRKHQIRQHLSLKGHPLLGDHLYGRRGAQKLFHRPALHSWMLRYDGECIKAPLPEDYTELLNRLRSVPVD